MHLLTRFQAKMRGFNTRKKYKNMLINQAIFLPNASINKFSIVSSTKIVSYSDVIILIRQMKTSEYYFSNITL